MLELESVANVMRGAGVWWAFAGGWAIDLWLGEQTREHHDIEVVIRRDEQAQVYAALIPNCLLFCLDPPGSGWSVWDGNPIERPAFQLQARTATSEFDLFTESTTVSVAGPLWSFRRDDRIVLPIDRVTSVSASGLPLVRPEIQLLYMAGSSEPKHGDDFEAVRSSLDAESRSWLACALADTRPSHPWVARL